MIEEAKFEKLENKPIKQQIEELLKNNSDKAFKRRDITEKFRDVKKVTISVYLYALKKANKVEHKQGYWKWIE